jgi:surface carbohydrate biosynthesis protein (TIGR04326 family)
MTDTAVLVLWDSDEAINVNAHKLVLWRSFREEASTETYSLPELVESNASRLRSKYLIWIKELGFSDGGTGRLLDRMEIRPGFSYWWMTLLAEKSSGKSTCIYDVVRLFALDDLCKKLQPKKIVLNTSSIVLREIIENWCSSARVEFEIYSNDKKSPIRRSGESKLGVVTEIVKSTVRICMYYARRSPLKKNIKNSSHYYSDISVMDYLVHLNRGSMQDGQYSSNYWTSMVDVVRESSQKVNWLHHYYEHAEISSPKKAKHLLGNFNKYNEKLEFHACIDSGLSWGVLGRVIKDYLTLLKYAWVLRSIRDDFRPSNTHLNLWPLYRNDWINSMLGSTAVWNCYTLNLLEVIFTNVKQQRFGIYLQENQGWEAALIHVWKTRGHGKLVGVPHATVRFWDLRYYHASCLFRKSYKNALPRPDFVAVNSPVAKNAYLEGGYPSAELLDVEALRYLYLNNIPVRRVERLVESSLDELRILILGDITPSVNYHLMKTVSDARKLLVRKAIFYVRPHPACPVDLASLTQIDFKVSDASMIESFNTCNVVVTGGSTSAAVDAYCSGLQVIQVLLPQQFNMCPLRGLPGVTYVRSAQKLKQVIDEFMFASYTDRKAYFNLDDRLPSWKKILDL